VALIAVFGIMPLINNNNGTTIARGDFALMISDEENVIAWFDSVEIEIEQVELYHETEGWQIIPLSGTIVDLTQLQGDWAQRVWEGKLPVGQYTKVSVDIGYLDAVLNITNPPLRIQLDEMPSLELELSFEIIEEGVTNFVYDMAVVDAGGTLETVPTESGPDQEFELVAP